MSDDEHFEKGDAGSSDYNPMTAGDVKKGGHCMLKGFPCKVSDYSTAKPGKHGSAKASITGVDIFTGKKVEDGMPVSTYMLEPIVTREEYEVADIDEDDFPSLILKNGSLKSDLKLPVEDEETYKQLKACWDKRGGNEVYFTVLSACKREKIIAGRIKQ